MSTVHVDRDVNKHIVNAVNRLKTLQHVHVTEELSSHYNYGTEEPCIRDRFRIEMGAKTKGIRCQVVLDSSNYYFPPDIIFDQSVIVNEVFDDVEEPSALLPAGDWNLKNENCLYDWFERLVDKLKKPPKSPLLSPPSPPVLSPRKKKKNWGIFNIENDSDDDLVISKEEKADSDEDFIPTESTRKSRSNSKGKRPARNQNVEAKETKRLKSFKEIGESKAYNVIDIDEEVAESILDSEQANKSPDTQLKKEKKAVPQRRNPYIDDTGIMDFEFDVKFKSIDLEEEKKSKPQRKNPYLEEASTMDFEFDDKPRNIELKDERSRAEGSTAIEKKKKKNPYIDEASTIHFDFDDKPKATTDLKKNPYIDDFEQIRIDKPEVKKAKKIDLMQKKRNLTQGSSKEAAVRLQKETQWGDSFMAVWRRRFEQHIMKMDERDTGLLTLYMPFKIESNSDQYQIYFEEKQRQLTEFREAQRMRPIDKVRPLKAMAPMLVRLELTSPTRLSVTLISVMNTREQASDEIDSIDLTYDLKQEKTASSEVNRIKDDIRQQAIHFHLFQTKLVN